jgi:pyrophosphatase PpaX
MTISTILFDFDGTLVQSLPKWLETYRYTFSFYDKELADERAFIKYWYQPLPETIAQVGAPSFGEFAGHMEKGFLKAFATLELYPGAREMLEACHQKKLTMGLVTSSPREALAYTLGRLKIEQYFDTIITSSDIKKPKPHPESVLVALSKLGKAASETLFVGDYIYDVAAGQEAGTHTALFLPPANSPYYDFEELRASRPDFTFAGYDELVAYLDLS